MIEEYGDGIMVDWTESEYNKLEEIKKRPLMQRQVYIRKKAVRMLFDSGLSRKEIVKVTGIPGRQVEDYLRNNNHRAKKFVQNGHTYNAHDFYSSNSRMWDKLFKRRTMKRMFTTGGGICQQ